MSLPDFHNRSNKLELLDAQRIPPEALYRNYRELHRVNQWLGGYKTSLKLFKFFKFSGNTCVWDIGCGGGETLSAIAHEAEKAKIPISLYGIDRHKPALDYAQKRNSGKPIHWIHASYSDTLPPEKADIIHCALFCHHLNPEELREYLLWARSHARQGILINDLRRSFPAWLGIWLISRWPGLSNLFRHDAPLSVLRSYNRREWQEMLSETGYSRVYIEKCPMYRYCICAYV